MSQNLLATPFNPNSYRLRPWKVHIPKRKWAYARLTFTNQIEEKITYDFCIMMCLVVVDIHIMLDVKHLTKCIFTTILHFKITPFYPKIGIWAWLYHFLMHVYTWLELNHFFPNYSRSTYFMHIVWTFMFDKLDSITCCSHHIVFNREKNTNGTSIKGLYAHEQGKKHKKV